MQQLHLAVLLVLAPLGLQPRVEAQSSGQRLSWRSPKELAPLRENELKLEACKPIIADLAKRAKQRGECVELAQEFLDVAVSTDHDHAIDSELMHAIHECAPPGVRGYLLRELEASASSEKSALILVAAAGWEDVRFDELVLREYLKDPGGFAWGWGDWFLERERYGPAMARVLARIEDPKQQDARILDEFMSAARELCRGTGKHTEWAAAMRRHALDPRDGLRRQALEYLHPHLASADLPLLREASKHPDWCTRRAAVDGLASLRSEAAFEALMDVLAGEEPDTRIGAGAVRCLSRLCGRSFARDTLAWRNWWSTEGKAGFRPRGKDEPEVPHGLADPGLLGTMVSSGRVLVVLDLDELVLRARVDTVAEARIASVRAALITYLRALHESSRWNVIVAREKPVVWRASLSTPAPEPSADARGGAREAAARRELEKLPPRELELALLDRFLDAELGLHVPEKRPEAKPLRATLEAAWAQAEADTFLFLSDGLRLVPEGDVREGKDEREECLEEWASSLDGRRKVRVHTFTLGADAARLRQLAEGQLGEYRVVP